MELGRAAGSNMYMLCTQMPLKSFTQFAKLNAYHRLKLGSMEVGLFVHCEP